MPSIGDIRRDAMMISAASIVRRYGFVSLTCASVANECTKRDVPTSVSLVKHYYGNRETLCRALGAYALEHRMQDLIEDARRLGIVE